MATDYHNWLDAPARIRVTGSGQFPMDQLRRECAWPAGTSDAYAILQDGKRSIDLVVLQRRFFSPDRWRSFGWTATDRDPFNVEAG